MVTILHAQVYLIFFYHNNNLILLCSSSLWLSKILSWATIDKQDTESLMLRPCMRVWKHKDSFSSWNAILQKGRWVFDQVFTPTCEGKDYGHIHRNQKSLPRGRHLGKSYNHTHHNQKLLHMEAVGQMLRPHSLQSKTSPIGEALGQRLWHTHHNKKSLWEERHWGKCYNILIAIKDLSLWKRVGKNATDTLIAIKNLSHRRGAGAKSMATLTAILKTSPSERKSS